MKPATVLMAWLIVGVAAAGQEYRAIDLGVLHDGQENRPSDINSTGQVAGWSYAASEATAFLWDGETMIDLGTFGDESSKAFAVNDLGQVVGCTWTGSEAGFAFLWQDGAVTEIENGLGGEGVGPFDIDNRSQVVGEANTPHDSQAFLWQDGEMTELGTLGAASSAYAINEVGQVAGWSEYVVAEPRAVLWESGTITDLGVSGDDQRAADINNLGQIVGWTRIDGEHRGFLWDDGEIAYFDAQSKAYGINDDGVVVGQLNGSAFIYDASTGVRILDDLLWSPQSDWHVECAYAINNDDWIAGCGTPPGGGRRSFIIRPRNCPADINDDGVVDLTDLAVLLAYYGQSGAHIDPEDGDIDCDGDVDLSDLAALLADYGMTCD